MARDRHTTFVEHNETNHSTLAGRLASSRRQSPILTQQIDGPPPENTAATIHATGSMDTKQHCRDPVQKHTSWIKQVQTRIASQNLEQQDWQPRVLLWLLHIRVYCWHSNPWTTWSDRLAVTDVHTNLSYRDGQTNQPDYQETQSSLIAWADNFSSATQYHLVCDGLHLAPRISHHFTKSLACHPHLQYRITLITFTRDTDRKHVTQRRNPSSQIGSSHLRCSDVGKRFVWEIASWTQLRMRSTTHVFYLSVHHRSQSKTS